MTTTRKQIKQHRLGVWYEHGPGQWRYRTLWPVRRDTQAVLNSDTMKAQYAGFDIYDMFGEPGQPGDANGDQRWLAKPDTDKLGPQPEYTARTMGLVLEMIEKHYLPNLGALIAYSNGRVRRHKGDR